MTCRVLFRTDSGNSLGMGHLMRCMALAQVFGAARAEVAFACRDQPGALLSLPQRAGYHLHEVADGNDALHTARFAAEWRADLIVVDHYALDAAWEDEVRSTVGRVLAIDDLADRPHACDWLLDQNDMQPEAGRYRKWLPADCRLLLGPRFALLRPEFLQARQACAPREGALRRVLVFFSGSDAGNETAKALAGLAALDDGYWWIDVVIGSGHPAPGDIETLCRRHGWHFHQQTDRMAALLAQADLCLGSAGTASWERCLLGVPAIVVELADNQREVLATLSRARCVKALGVADRITALDYATAVSSLQREELSNMSLAAWNLVDGQGATRVVRDVLATRGAA